MVARIAALVFALHHLIVGDAFTVASRSATTSDHSERFKQAICTVRSLGNVNCTGLIVSNEI
jgi:hypothetical protein